MSKASGLVPLERIEGAIIVLRGQKVMLDETLAELYGVPVKRLTEQVKRNIDRFPEDFMFQLSSDETEILRSHFATSSQRGHGGRRYAPRVFTEQGVAMLSSVLHSTQAVQVNIEIMRAFVRLRQMLQSNADLSRRLDNLERKYDAQFKQVFQAIRELMEPIQKPKRRLGFKDDK